MKQITWSGFLNRSGYAQACQDYVLSLHQGGYDVSLKLFHTKIDEISLTREKLALLSKLALESPAHPIFVYHCIPDMQRRFPHKGKTLGFATFETYRPPEHWTKLLNQNDGVVVPSEFNRRVFLQAGVTKPVFYLPHCLDMTAYTPSTEPLKLGQVEPDEFVFLFVGTWKKRKGWEPLIQAWCKEFDAKDRVRLVLKTDRLLMGQRAVDAIKKQVGNKEFAPISFESRILNEAELPRLFKSADCLVCPTLGEGFGLPGLQAMAVGTPVLITDFSGCQDYATEETATLIKPNKFIVYPEMDMYPQYQNCPWAHIEVKEVAQKMRFVLQNREAVKQKASKAVNFVAERFSYQANVARFDDIIKSL
jgi:glycosyltransferase involved in cell wall biosynthesis